MHSSEVLQAGWIVWGMVLAGAGLILASLWRTSERFWYWKQARQMAAGEVTPASEALRIGQRFQLLPDENGAQSQSTRLNEEADRIVSRLLETACPSGHIVGITRGLLVLSLEPETVTRDEERSQQYNPFVYAGQTLTVQITGQSELFRFSADVRSICPDPEHPQHTRVTMKLPFWLARIQRRQQVRAPVRSSVTLQAAEESISGNSPAQVMRGTLHDLSGGGLCLELDSPQRPDSLAQLCTQWGEGAMLKCSLNMPLLRDTPLHLRVHSCERIVVRGGLGLRIRGEFAHIPAWQQETIVSLVFQAQRQYLNQHAPRFETVV